MYKLAIPSSIEERIVLLQELKRGTVNWMLGTADEEGGGTGGGLTRQELFKLIGRNRLA